uniref:Late expression factor 11 n=1 Tax=Heterorhabditis bacteriophora TaxID=37862 RepID=A0A1I7XCL5_HETBA
MLDFDYVCEETIGILHCIKIDLYVQVVYSFPFALLKCYIFNAFLELKYVKCYRHGVLVHVQTILRLSCVVSNKGFIVIHGMISPTLCRRKICELLCTYDEEQYANELNQFWRSETLRKALLGNVKWDMDDLLYRSKLIGNRLHSLLSPKKRISSDTLSEHRRMQVFNTKFKKYRFFRYDLEF